MPTLKNLAYFARDNRYVICALAFLAVVGPGIVRLADILKTVQGH